MSYVLDKTLIIAKVRIAAVSRQTIDARGSFFMVRKHPVAVLVADKTGICVIGLQEDAATTEQLAGIAPGLVEAFQASLDLPPG